MMKFKPDWLLKPAEIKGLNGARISLKAPSFCDYLAWVEVRGRNQAFLTPYEPTWLIGCLTKGFFERRIKRQARERRAGRAEYYFLHKGDDIIGGLNLNNLQMGAARHATLGYWIDEAYQGQGYMSEAIRIIIDHAFITLKLQRLNAACLVDNNRSIYLLKALGFEEDGYAKKYLQINGTWQDHRLFGLCRDL